MTNLLPWLAPSKETNNAPPALRFFVSQKRPLACYAVVALPFPTSPSQIRSATAATFSRAGVLVPKQFVNSLNRIRRASPHDAKAKEPRRLGLF